MAEMTVMQALTEASRLIDLVRTAQANGQPTITFGGLGYVEGPAVDAMRPFIKGTSQESRTFAVHAWDVDIPLGGGRSKIVRPWEEDWPAAVRLMAGSVDAKLAGLPWPASMAPTRQNARAWLLAVYADAFVKQWPSWFSQEFPA